MNTVLELAPHITKRVHVTPSVRPSPNTSKKHS